MQIAGKRTLTSWVDEQQASGRYVFTSAEIPQTLRSSAVAVQTALRRLKQRGRIAAPRRGFYVIVPLEYRAAGCPPASWFVDALMKHIDREYYVGLLSAAALHGAAHQQPMVFQVITDRWTRPMRAGRVTIEAHVRKELSKMPTIPVLTETGSMTVASPETAAFDIVRFFSSAGHWSNVATVLSELAETLDGDKLAEIAPRVNLPDVQRLGYLLTLAGEGEVARPLADWLAGRRSPIVRLRTGRPATGVRPDPRWRLIPNEEIDIDI